MRRKPSFSMVVMFVSTRGLSRLIRQCFAIAKKDAEDIRLFLQIPTAGADTDGLDGHGRHRAESFRIILEQGGSGRRRQLKLDVRRDNRYSLEQLRRGRSGDGTDSMCDLNGAVTGRNF